MPKTMYLSSRLQLCNIIYLIFITIGALSMPILRTMYILSRLWLWNVIYIIFVIIVATMSISMCFRLYFWNIFHLAFIIIGATVTFLKGIFLHDHNFPASVLPRYHAAQCSASVITNYQVFECNRPFLCANTYLAEGTSCRLIFTNEMKFMKVNKKRGRKWKEEIKRDSTSPENLHLVTVINLSTPDAPEF